MTSQEKTRETADNNRNQPHDKWGETEIDAHKSSRKRAAGQNKNGAGPPEVCRRFAPRTLPRECQVLGRVGGVAACAHSARMSILTPKNTKRTWEHESH